ncbi:hypothetical protein PSTT_16817 [Puccinia striiformis]|uniref:Uncharacterized protein n=1 Tax=Puccinia striiformis TaxID=27350 RepID=A0A2S4UB53_9BASI|nr:hypothetical protein PSTT_16817 [Puccinia striiformis]
MDLTVLTSPSAGIHSVSDQSGPTHDTITCFRLSGLTPQVWLVCVSSAASLPTTVLASICWTPCQTLVAGLSSRSTTGPPMFILLSVHSGQLLAFPTVVTSSDLNLQSTPLHSDQPLNQSTQLDSGR